MAINKGIFVCVGMFLVFLEDPLSYLLEIWHSYCWGPQKECSVEFEIVFLSGSHFFDMNFFVICLCMYVPRLFRELIVLST